MNLYDVIQFPVLTEKAESLRQNNVYAFVVNSKANKTLVKQAVKEIYGVVPVKINIMNTMAKGKRNKFGIGYKSDNKKAYVYLDKKDKIELFEGV